MTILIGSGKEVAVEFPYLVGRSLSSNGVQHIFHRDNSHSVCNKVSAPFDEYSEDSLSEFDVCKSCLKSFLKEFDLPSLNELREVDEKIPSSFSEKASPGEVDTLSVSDYITCSFIPKSDITGYELSLLIPYLLDSRGILKSELDSLGSVVRHLEFKEAEYINSYGEPEIITRPFLLVRWVNFIRTTPVTLFHLLISIIFICIVMSL